ncbi:V-type proton ATPase subunit S1-like protein [Protopterus annectens]|uniref:V-type proton ATPase subunit S1-like protein n=1 Tax=Protopterus annectens TaxID=7888 RepID=UPI001CF97954|nr:V-type proton ATPase subunit S1-like protein [Protopterus annectens]
MGASQKTEGKEREAKLEGHMQTVVVSNEGELKPETPIQDPTPQIEQERSCDGDTFSQLIKEPNNDFIDKTSPVATTLVTPVTGSTSNLTKRSGWKLHKTLDGNHYMPVNFSINGQTCILFWAKRISIKFKSYTHLDLTDEDIGANAVVDLKQSNCSEGSAVLSLKFGDVSTFKDLVIRFVMSSTYYKLSAQKWFRLDKVHLIFNDSWRHTFNATDISAPVTDSYYCEHVSSLQKYRALLVPSKKDDTTKSWQLTFADFQIQGFGAGAEGFSHAMACASFFSPAILMGLVMSLILLLVLAYVLHMIIHLKSIDKYYECKPSTAYFSANKESDTEDEKEPLRSNTERYNLKHQPVCRFYMQQCPQISN